MSKKYRNNFTLLAWIIDVYYLELAFNEAQKKKLIPYDVPFDPFGIVIGGMSDMTSKFPYWLSLDARIKIQQLAKIHKIKDMTSSGLIGYDSKDQLRGIEFIRVNNEIGIYVESAMHHQNFPGMFTDLFSEILFVLLFEKVENHLKTGRNLENLNIIYNKVEKYRSNLQLATSHSFSSAPDHDWFYPSSTPTRQKLD